MVGILLAIGGLRVAAYDWKLEGSKGSYAAQPEEETS